MDYWEECIKEAFEETKITATKEQIDIVISWIEGAHENYRMAMGYDCIPNPVETENKRLKEEVKKEREKVFCKKCNGKGYVISYFGSLQSTSSCDKCYGVGRHSPN